MCHRYIKRNGYGYRKPNYIGQKKPLEQEIDVKQLQQVMNDCLDLRTQFDIKQNMIGNFDEINFQMNVIRDKTLAQKGADFVFVKTHGQERNTFTLGLSILSNGGKLPPIIIFKAKQQGRLENQLQQIDLVSQNRVHVLCHPSGWTSERSIKYYLNNIWLEHTRNSQQSMLLLDEASTHTSEQIIQIYDNNDKDWFVFVPPRQSIFVQPLDRSPNKLFRAAFKKFYFNYCQQKGINTGDKLQYKDIIQAINDIWYNDQIITQDIIKRSFQHTGIILNSKTEINQKIDEFKMFKRFE